VARWEAQPRERLTRAALELFVERGYDATTVAEIADRAGLTKSTFFRHFDDKREVLFGTQEGMVAALLETGAYPLSDETPAGCLRALLGALTGYFPQNHRALAATRAAVISAHPELRERDLLKRAQLGSTIEDALTHRNIDKVTARLAATMGLLAVDIAFERWIRGANRTSFGDLLDQALPELLEQAAAFAGPAHPSA
jgi:AcrR family transcriptional regulator